MKITDLILKLQVLAAVNPNLIVVIPEHSDYSPVGTVVVRKFYQIPGCNFYTIGKYRNSLEKELVMIEVE